MKQFKAFRTEDSDQGFVSAVKMIDFDTLADADVIVNVRYSGINYKDLLSATGNKGVTKHYPHTPGIDAAGVVISDRTGHFKAGDEVVVMGYDLGMNHDGGFAEYISVPVGWVMAKPKKFTLKECMQIGTSGFTAAMGIMKMQKLGQLPERGPIVVSGATGGVGSFAVRLLSTLGFDVWAVTGKEAYHQALRDLGASEILGRQDIMAPPEKPLLRSRWAGAFDTVGGETLVSLLKQCGKSGSVATCGNVGGKDLVMTVFPFILNGINLLGINAADTPMTEREEVWNFLSEEVNPKDVALMGKEITLEQVSEALTSIKNHTHTGRYTVKI